jgi:hypothetical protein
MSDNKDVEIDPRFDPAFQRGFDQTIPIEEYVPAPLPKKTAVAPAPVAPAAALPRVEPAVPTAPAAPLAPTVERSEPVEVAAVEFESDPETAQTEASALDSDSNPSRNPFLLFLAIISIALVAVGVWLFVRSGDAFNSKEVRSQGDYMSLDATIHMAPFIALLGAATAIGVVFVFASKWRKRK